MLVRSSPKIYTLEEYRTLEATAECRHEYHDGEIIEMTGGSIHHNRLVRDLIRLLDTALKNSSYEVFPSALRLWIPRYNKGLYPDIMGIAGEPVLTENRADEVQNPCLIIEVLSKSTSGYDRGEKFRYYRAIDSLQESLLVNQYEYSIEHYTKTGERRWLLEDCQGEQAILKLESVGLSLPILDIYDGINFSLID